MRIETRDVIQGVMENIRWFLICRTCQTKLHEVVSFYMIGNEWLWSLYTFCRCFVVLFCVVVACTDIIRDTVYLFDVSYCTRAFSLSFLYTGIKCALTYVIYTCTYGEMENRREF